jgi:predicted porin
MKKTLIALAALASTAAFAQSSVTLSGKMGAGVTVNNYVNGTSLKTLNSTDAAVTFAVTEDLGGGMKVAASQTLAAGGAQGGGVTHDGASLAISGGFGEAKFGMSCAGAALGEAVVGGQYHFAHALGTTGSDCREYKYGLYTLPALVNGLTVAVRIQNMAAGGNVDLSNFNATNNGLQYRFNYATGPLAVALYAKSNSSEIHASYDLGVAKVSYGADTKVTSGDKRSEIGVSVPVGALTLKAGYGKKGAIKGTEVGAFYALSKRTTLGATMGNFTPNAGQSTSVAQDKPARVSLVHAF